MFKFIQTFVATAMLSIFTFSSALAETNATLTVVVENISKQQGNLMMAVYDKKQNYDGDIEPAYVVREIVATPSMKVELDVAAPSTYAIKLYVDENKNGEIDFNIMGIPKEPYGFSNNKGRFGPPSYTDASFDVAGDTSTTIKLH